MSSSDIWVLPEDSNLRAQLLDSVASGQIQRRDTNGDLIELRYQVQFSDFGTLGLEWFSLCKNEYNNKYISVSHALKMAMEDIDDNESSLSRLSYEGVRIICCQTPNDPPEVIVELSYKDAVELYQNQ